jgi:RHS repeat-associated protein
MRTTYNGGVEGSYTSLPFGDGYAASGADTDANHYAQLDHDFESDTEYAQNRQYSNTQGRWLSPDPYHGSYQWRNPQSFNRYAYVGNNPLASVDPSGLIRASNTLEPELNAPNGGNADTVDLYMDNAGGGGDGSSGGASDTSNTDTSNTDTNSSVTTAPTPSSLTTTAPAISAEDAALASLAAYAAADQDAEDAVDVNGNSSSSTDGTLIAQNNLMQAIQGDNPITPLVQAIQESNPLTPFINPSPYLACVEKFTLATGAGGFAGGVAAAPFSGASSIPSATVAGFAGGAVTGMIMCSN